MPSTNISYINSAEHIYENLLIIRDRLKSMEDNIAWVDAGAHRTAFQAWIDDAQKVLTTLNPNLTA